MTAHRDNPLFIGVDGGATEIKAHEVVEVEGGLVAGSASAAFRANSGPDFEAVPLADQLAAHQQGRVIPTSAEREAGERWIDAAAQAVLSVAARRGRSRVVVGLCWPGLKTADARGIAVMRNGPRIPDFLDRFEARLAREGLVLEAPIARLLSDGEACGLGEEVSPSGGFRGVATAYYLGGGTGLAECFKLADRIVGLDELAPHVQKAWQMTSENGATFEDRLSMRGIQARFERMSGADVAILPFVERAALEGDHTAIATLCEAAEVLADLVVARSAALLQHAGARLERAVVGQRLGLLFAEPALLDRFRRIAEASLARRAPIELVGSTLREAPALGAVCAAWRERAARRGEHG